MPRLLLAIAAFWFAALAGVHAADPAATTLWYNQPAQKWTEALPIGNGRLGAMIFGGVPDERIQFNEDTLWTGHPHDYVRAGASNQLATIRQLLAAGKVKEAVTLAHDKFLSDPVRQKAYQPFGDLHLHFPDQDTVTDYRRRTRSHHCHRHHHLPQRRRHLQTRSLRQLPRPGHHHPPHR